MKSTLAVLFAELGNVAVSHLAKKVKIKMMQAVISYSLILIFALISLMFLFVLAYSGLSQAYDSQTAALVLFGVALFLSVGTWLVHTLAARAAENARRRPLLNMLETSKKGARNEKRAEALPPGVLIGAQLGRQAREVLERNSLPLAATALGIGLLTGFRPRAAGWIIARLLKSRR